YTGAYQFQDGTVHLSHRFYDTSTLGFTQPDPSRQELNNHTYAMCDPINNTDPTGLSLRNVSTCGLVSTLNNIGTATFVLGLGTTIGSIYAGGPFTPLGKGMIIAGVAGVALGAAASLVGGELDRRLC
ncbi:RHS repeat-associated core domain-containing protein, partial [Nocardiopsis sp. MG754419]|uniref:RHS repeat-associated core domain-containing protein n=1 Tax=Nocardiopsis sp. MG754419 TaxID=2259865 RepID=UPI0024B2161B